jgi:hypothetical protein
LPVCRHFAKDRGYDVAVMLLPLQAFSCFDLDRLLTGSLVQKTNVPPMLQ